jgi:hypothetical protein
MSGLRPSLALAAGVWAFDTAVLVKSLLLRCQVVALRRAEADCAPSDNWRHGFAFEPRPAFGESFTLALFFCCGFFG